MLLEGDPSVASMVDVNARANSAHACHTATAEGYFCPNGERANALRAAEAASSLAAV